MNEEMLPFEKLVMDTADEMPGPPPGVLRNVCGSCPPDETCDNPTCSNHFSGVGAEQ